MKKEFIIKSKEINGPFSLKLTIESDQRSQEIWEWDGTTVVRSDEICKKPIRIAVTQIGSVESPKIRVQIFSSKYINNYEAQIARKRVISCLGLSDDLREFYEKFKDDKGLGKPIKKLYGLRLMRDPEPFETLITGICSQNTSIKRWNLMIRSLIDNLGQSFVIEGKRYNLFPTPSDILSKYKKLKKCGLGYRDKYVKAAAESVNSCELDFRN